LPFEDVAADTVRGVVASPVAPDGLGEAEIASSKIARAKRRSDRYRNRSPADRERQRHPRVISDILDLQLHVKAHRVHIATGIHQDIASPIRTSDSGIEGGGIVKGYGRERRLAAENVEA
jgi:hypothetical protein